ncbi:odorant receptor 4-like [Megalopta genalis]|uniref:odorant receptor 4-like n=1 Tax=Megalopta genalis TaxID=115081 RepID=UPI003FD1AFBF
MISYSLIITLIGLQILLGAPDSGRRYTFMSFLCTKFIQLLMFTYTCDGVIQESLNVAPAIFNAPWYSMLMNKYGRMLRRDLKLVILRSRNPCCITAKRFFPISLETYTKVYVHEGVRTHIISYNYIINFKTTKPFLQLCDQRYIRESSDLEHF